MPELYDIASKFRNAIQAAIRSGDVSDINLRNFPFGACGYTSDLLQRYLSEKGVPTLYVSGQYGNGLEAKNHAWIETLDGTVIDITGDQFASQEPHFSVPVYVGPRENGFHDKFILEDPKLYQPSEDPFYYDKKFEDRYRAVIGHMIY